MSEESFLPKKSYTQIQNTVINWILKKKSVSYFVTAALSMCFMLIAHAGKVLCPIFYDFLKRKVPAFSISFI